MPCRSLPPRRTARLPQPVLLPSRIARYYNIQKKIRFFGGRTLSWRRNYRTSRLSIKRSLAIEDRAQIVFSALICNSLARFGVSGRGARTCGSVADVEKNTFKTKYEGMKLAWEDQAKIVFSALICGTQASGSVVLRIRSGNIAAYLRWNVAAYRGRFFSYSENNSSGVSRSAPTPQGTNRRCPCGTPISQYSKSAKKFPDCGQKIIFILFP